MVHANPNDFAVMLNPQSKNAENVGKWIHEHMDARTDPASKTPGAAPLYGQDAVPHLLTYQSVVGSFSRAYVNPDEAMRDSIENAHLMEKDVGLLESVECRQRLTALLDWEIKPEDEKCQYQVSLAQELQRIISRIRNFTKYRMWLMKAIWSGRSGIQHKYGYTRVNGAMRMMPTPLHRDHNGWMPINGDKLVFRYEDGWMDSDEGAYPHQMGIRVGTNPGKGKLRIHRDYKLEPVSDGLALFLKPYERDTFCVHKHFIEDADFHHSYFAGSVHGIGIRSKIYWEWFLKQEAFAFLMQYLERSAGGIEVWTYPMGDPKALAATQAAAKEKMSNGRNIVFFPKPMGDDSESYKFEVIEPGAMGLDIMQNIIENYFGGRLKRYILGQELSTEAKATGMGSGVAEAHMDTLSQIVQFDASNLEETLTHELVRYIQQLNFPETMGWHMRMSLKTKDDKTQERLEALNAAYQMGASIAESEVFKTLGLSAPTSGEKVLSLSSQQAASMPPGMPGMPPMGGNPDGDNSGPDGFPDGGSFPDQENGDNPESEDDGEQDPVDLIRSLMEQYAQQMERDQYGTQGMFKWEENLHPRESSTDTVHKAGQFTSKKTAPQQKSLFEGVTPAAKQSGRFSGKPRSGRKALNDRIRDLFAEHAENRQKQLSFDDPVETPAPVPEPKPVSQLRQEENIEETPVPEPVAPPVQAPATAATSAPPKRRMMGASADSMKAVAQPAAPPVQPKPQPAPPKQSDPPSVETVTQPTNQPAVAAQPVNTSAQVPTERKPGALTPEQQDLITDHYNDHMKRITRLASEKFAGYKRNDRDAFDSAISDGLTRAAQLWDGVSDFPAFAQKWAFINLKNLNPNRRKLNTITSNQSGDGEIDPLANVAGRSSEPDYGDDERAKLDKAISSLGNEQDQWLVKAWFSGEDEDGNTVNQSQAAEAYNGKFGQNLTRQAIGYRATQLLNKLKSQLASDPDQYAAVRNMIVRYYRREMVELQKERYERRQDRTIREAAEYTESDPTDAQIKAGNYKKGRFSWNGMQIVIENPRGSTRRGVASSGEIWRREMTAHYGYISGTKGTDGDQVDVFMGRNPESEVVFVICQTNKDGSFDEHKAVLGTTNKRKACDLYLSHYPKGWKCGEVVAMTVSQFKEWLNSGECCHE